MAVILMYPILSYHMITKKNRPQGIMDILKYILIAIGKGKHAVALACFAFGGDDNKDVSGD